MDQSWTEVIAHLQVTGSAGDYTTEFSMEILFIWLMLLAVRVLLRGTGGMTARDVVSVLAKPILRLSLFAVRAVGRLFSSLAVVIQKKLSQDERIS